MVSYVQLGLRGVQFVLTIMIMGLTGNMIATSFSGNPSVVNYAIFVTLFGLVSLIYLLLISFKEQYSIHKLFPAVLDGLNILFYFTCAIAFSAELGAHSCSNPGYTTTNRITNGSRDTAGRCHEAQASTAFLWFAWAAFCVSLAFTVKQSGGANLRGGRRGGPSMSQV